MYRKLEDFLDDWAGEAKATVRLLESLTDPSLEQRVTPEGRSLGQVARHLTLTLGEMLRRAGLPIDAPGDDAPVPALARTIRDTYQQNAEALGEQVRQHWSDAMLTDELQMYGETWKRGDVLSALVMHQAHHRGQMTVLMRQTGLRVPGVYGPAREERATYKMPAP